MFLPDWARKDRFLRSFFLLYSSLFGCLTFSPAFERLLVAPKCRRRVELVLITMQQTGVNDISLPAQEVPCCPIWGTFVICPQACFAREPRSQAAIPTFGCLPWDASSRRSIRVCYCYFQAPNPLSQATFHPPCRNLRSEVACFGLSRNSRDAT